MRPANELGPMPTRKPPATRTKRASKADLDADVKSGKRLKYLTGNATASAIDAIIDPNTDSWTSNPDGSYSHGDRDGTFVTISPTASDPAARRDIAREIIASLGPEAVQTFFFLMSRDLAREPSERGKKVTLHVNDILDFKGKVRKKRDHKTEDKIEQAKELFALSDLWISVDDMVEIATKRGVRRKRIKLTSRAIDLAVETEVTSRVGSEDDARDIADRAKSNAQLGLPLGENRVPFRFRYEMGEYARAYESTPQLFVHQTLATIGRYRTDILQERYAIYFTLVLMFESRLVWSVGELVKRAGIPLPTHHADRFREGIERALYLLKRDHLIADWKYEDGDIDLPFHRWLDAWLEKYVVVIVPINHLGDQRTPTAALTGD
jgi:hypothetical protein